MSTFPARRILIPMDLTSLSRHAREWARLFGGSDAAYEALFVYDLPLAPVLELPYVPMPRLSVQRAAEFLARACPGARAAVVEGDPADVIARRSARAGLVVMAAHGRRGAARLLWGSVSEAVARDARAPLLVVRGPVREIRSVLAPVNLTPYSRRGLALAAEAAAFLGTGLAVLHVSAPGKAGPNPRFFLNQMIEELPPALRAAARPRIVLRSGETVGEILRESARHGLVVLTAHRKPLLEDWTIGTTAERVLRHARIPVLTAPSPR